MRYNTLSELQNVINTLYEIDDILQGESSEAVKKAIAAVQDAWNVVKRERRDENRDKLIRQNAILQARRETFVDEDKVRELVLSSKMKVICIVSELDRLLITLKRKLQKVFMMKQKH